MIDFYKAIKHFAIDQWDDRPILELTNLLNKVFKNVPDAGFDFSPLSDTEGSCMFAYDKDTGKVTAVKPSDIPGYDNTNEISFNRLNTIGNVSVSLTGTGIVTAKATPSTMNPTKHTMLYLGDGCQINYPISSYYGKENIIRGNVTNIGLGSVSVDYVDLSKNPDLLGFSSNACNVDSLDLSANKKLESLSVLSTTLKSLYLSACKALKSLSFKSDKLDTQLDISNNNELETLSLSSYPFDSINIGSCSKLRTIHTRSSKIKNINLQNCKDIHVIDARYSELESVTLPTEFNLDYSTLYEVYVYASPIWTNGKLDELIAALPTIEHKAGGSWNGLFYYYENVYNPGEEGEICYTLTSAQVTALNKKGWIEKNDYQS